MFKLAFLPACKSGAGAKICFPLPLCFNAFSALTPTTTTKEKHSTNVTYDKEIAKVRREPKFSFKLDAWTRMNTFPLQAFNIFFLPSWDITIQGRALTAIHNSFERPQAAVNLASYLFCASSHSLLRVAKVSNFIVCHTYYRRV